MQRSDCRPLGGDLKYPTKCIFVTLASMSAALLAYLAARKRHKKEKKRREIDAVIEALKDDEDREDDRAAAKLLQDTKDKQLAAREESRRQERARETIGGRVCRIIMAVVGSTYLQTVQYVVTVSYTHLTLPTKRIV